MMMDFEVIVKGAKRCPMCGCEHIVADSRDLFESHNFRTVGISCNNCGLTLRKGYSENYDEAFKEAMTAWNRRAAV